MAKAKTRHGSGSHLSEWVGTGKKMLTSEVPTVRSVLRQGILLKEEALLEQDVKVNLYLVDELVKDLAPLVQEQWRKSNVKFCPPVTVSDKAIKDRLKRIWTKATDIAGGRAGIKAKTAFEKQLDKLFDICICKCKITLCGEEESPCKDGCTKGAHIMCSCPLAVKVPVLELQWLHSQRQKIGEKSSFSVEGDDKMETKRQIKADKRRAAEEESLEKKKIKQIEEEAELRRIKACSEEDEASEEETEQIEMDNLELESPQEKAM